jgi:hypothetical protein
MKNAVFWNMTTPCGSYRNHRFGGTYCLHLQGKRRSPLDSQRGYTSQRMGKRIIKTTWRGNKVLQDKIVFLYPEDGDASFLRNIGTCTALHPNEQQSSLTS